MEKSIIGQVPLFSTLPQAELDALVAELKERNYPVQTILFQEGDFGDKFYILLDGQVEIIKAMDTPNERILAIRGSGEFIGEMSLLNRDGLRTASARAHSDVRVWEMTRTDFDALLHRVPTIAYEMLRVLSMRLRQAHNESIRELKEKNLRLEEAYTNLKAAQAQIIEKEILERELDQAREIQESILPTALPHVEGIEIGAQMVSARAVGGDFYDAISLDLDNLGLVVGDVSGKGVPAALFMALTCSLLRAEAMRSMQPEKVLHRVNQNLLGMNSKGMFVTVLYGIFNRTTREFIYVRAGHELPLVWNFNGEIIPISFKTGQPLGLFPNPILEAQKLTLPPESTMLLYTDGVTEAKNGQGGFFGEDGLATLVPDLSRMPAQRLCDYVIRVLKDYHGNSPQADDITLLAVRAQS